MLASLIAALRSVRAHSPFLALSGILAVAVAACGGGGGSPPPPPAAAPSINGSVTVAGQVAPTAATSASAAEAVEHSHPSNVRVGEAIVTLRQERRADGHAAVAEVLEAFPELELELVRESTPAGPFLVRIGKAYDQTTTEDAGLAIAAHAAVAAVDANRDVASRGMQGQPSLNPNDPQYGTQWHYKLIGLPQAWGITVGDPNIRVAVLDTEFDLTHPDLAGNLLPGIDAGAKTTNPGYAPGGESHGTHVAGTIAGVTNNKAGAAGIAWNCKIVPVKVTPGELMAWCDGIRWAIGQQVTGLPLNQNPVRVINMSLGTLNGPACVLTPVPACVEEAINEATAAGVIVVAAAGNERADCGQVADQTSSPALHPNSIGVAAVQPDGTVSPFSNRASTNFIAAPGGDQTGSAAGSVLSTVPQGKYASFDGTSMASPHVAGVVALMLSANPLLTPAQVRQILQETALDKGAPGWDMDYGHGLIQADKAVRRAKDLPAPTVPVLAVLPDPLSFSASVSEQKLRVENRGAGTITINSVAATTSSGGNWLTVMAPAAGTAAPAEIVVQVDRTGLTAGQRYTGRITVQTSAGNKVVPVSLIVGKPLDIGDVTVKLLKKSDGSTVATKATGVAQGYQFSFTGIPADTYKIEVAGPGSGPAQYKGVFPPPSRLNPLVVNGPVTVPAIPLTRGGGTARTKGASGVAITDGLLAAVYRAGTDEPLSGATVSIAGGASAETDSEGEATFSGLSGPVTISATAPGYGAVTFVAINSDVVEFDLLPAGTDAVQVALDVTVTGMEDGETGVVSAIVDGEIEDVAQVTSAAPTASVQVLPGRPLLVGVVVSSMGTANKLNVEELEPIFEASSVSIEALAAESSATTMGTITAPVGGTFDPMGQTYAVVALAFDDDDTQFLLGLSGEAAFAAPYSLSRAGLGAEFDANVEGALIAFGEDAQENSSVQFVYGTLEELPAMFSGTLRDVPALGMPMDGAMGVGTTPTFTFTPVAGASLVNLVIYGPDGFVWEVFAPGTATTIELPALPGGAGLQAATGYQWSVGDAVVPEFSFDEFSLDFDLFATEVTESLTRSFTTQ